MRTLTINNSLMLQLFLNAEKFSMLLSSIFRIMFDDTRFTLVWLNFVFFSVFRNYFVQQTRFKSGSEGTSRDVWYGI